MQNREKYRVLELKKNRYDGDVGKTALAFDRYSKRFFELSLAEVHGILKETMKVNELIKIK